MPVNYIIMKKEHKLYIYIYTSQEKFVFVEINVSTISTFYSQIVEILKKGVKVLNMFVFMLILFKKNRKFKEKWQNPGKITAYKNYMFKRKKKRTFETKKEQIIYYKRPGKWSIQCTVQEFLEINIMFVK